MTKNTTIRERTISLKEAEQRYKKCVDKYPLDNLNCPTFEEFMQTWKYKLKCLCINRTESALHQPRCPRYIFVLKNATTLFERNRAARIMDKFEIEMDTSLCTKCNTTARWSTWKALRQNILNDDKI